MDTSKRSKDWGDEMLYFNTPDVFLTGQGVISANPAESTADISALKQNDASQLMQAVGDEKTPMPARRVAAKALVEKRAATRDFKELTRGLHEANMVYTYRDTVEALVKAGRDAVPFVLERLNDPAGSSGGKKYAIKGAGLRHPCPSLCRMSCHPAVMAMRRGLTASRLGKVRTNSPFLWAALIPAVSTRSGNSKAARYRISGISLRTSE